MGKYHYYAFISYSRKNTKAAAFLHRSLERFRIPAKYVAEEFRPNGQKFLRPVFRDRRDLEVKEGSFTNDIKSAIERSRYLVVLCSPDSAESLWVNEEIKHFLATHNNDLNGIVPVILTGKPGHGGDVECLPPALQTESITARNLPSMVPDEGDSESAGWENGVVQALSYMLHVNREKIKATVDAEKLRQARLNMMIGAVILVIFAALTLWAIRAERTAAANEKLAQENEAKAKENEQRAVAGEKLAQDNEAKAKEQAEIAKKSLEFLRDMFQSTDPTRTGSKDMKVLDAIRSKLPEIKNLKPWQLQASVALEVGLVLSNIGDYEEAGKLYQTALELTRQNDPDSEREARIHDDLCVYYLTMNKPDKAHEHANRLFEIREKISGKDSPELYSAYIHMAAIEYTRGNYKKAEELTEKSMSHFKKLDQQSAAAAVNILNSLCVIFAAQKKYEDSLTVAQTALDLLEKYQKDNTYMRALLYQNMASAYFALDKLQEAVSCQKKALEIFQDLLGENHIATLTAYGNLAKLNQRAGNTADAAADAEKAYSGLKALFGEKHANTITACARLGQIYARQAQLQKGLQHIEKAATLAAEVLGKDHPDTRMYEKELEYLKKLDAEKDFTDEEKAKILTEADGYTVGIPEKVMKECEKYGNLFFVNYEAGKTDVAFDYLNKRIDLLAKYKGEYNPDMIPEYDLAALLYEEHKNQKKAAEFRKKLLEIQKRKSGDKHPDLIPLYENLAFCFMESSDHTAALEALTAMLQILETQEGRYKEKIYAYLYISKCYCCLHKKEEFMAYGNKAIALARSLGDEYKKELELSEKTLQEYMLHYAFQQEE